jgi:hypothetical protein
MCGVKVWDTTYHNVGGIREAPGKGDGDGGDGETKKSAAETRSAAERVEALDATAREDAEKIQRKEREEEEEKAARIAREVVSNRLAGSTSLSSAAREMATASVGKAVTSWQYDPGSGLYYDVGAQLYYDPRTKKSYDCETGKWIEPEAPSNSQMATGEKTGTFQKGTRKPDRFGL